MTQTSKQSFQTFPKTIATMADDDNQLEDNSEKVKRKRGCDTHTKTETSDVYILTKAAKGQTSEVDCDDHEPDPRSFDKMNISDESHESASLQNGENETVSLSYILNTSIPHHLSDCSCECRHFQGNSNSEAHVPISRLQLRIVNVRVPSKDGEVVQERLVLAYELPTEQQGQRCYDLDIGFRMHCPLLTRPAYDQPFEYSNTMRSVLVLRKRYLRSVFGPKQCCYPDYITVQGAAYSIHHGDIQGSDGRKPSLYCYGFPLEAETLVPELRVEIQRVEVAAPAEQGQQAVRRTTRHSATATGAPAARPIQSSIALVMVEGKVSVTRTDRPEERAQQTLHALLLSFAPQSTFTELGAQLWDALYGEVYCGRWLCWSESEEVFVLGREEEALAVKVVRHPNNLWGSAGRIGMHTDCGGRRCTLSRIHHDTSAALTSSHLAGYFEDQCRQGRNENVMREVETMALIQRAVQAEENSTVLSRRFLYLTETALSEDNLLIATEFLPFNSLSSYMHRKERVGKPLAFNLDLTEVCVRHVLRQLLEALVFLHDRGIAHQDLSVENVALRVPTALSSSGLARKHQLFLTAEEFLRLEVVLIDLGHAGTHAPCIPSASLQNAQLNISSTTVNTATTCESSCSAESGSPCDECTIAPVPLPAPPSERAFQLRRSGKNPVGKKPYRAPELVPEVDFHGDSKGPLGREYCGMCVDMWQLGALAVHMRTGRQPVNCDDRDLSGGGLLRRVLTWYAQSRDQALGDRPVAVQVTETKEAGVRLHQCFSAEGWDLVSKLLAFRPEHRLTARAALQHPWFRLQDSSSSSSALKGELYGVAAQVYAAAAADAKAQS